ncbi:MAG: phosphatase PAP2 family protein [Eggerthellaceae bacterium]|nr:phosphatase PAP2 family protein [Eggerthellaceae bacterium]
MDYPSWYKKVSAPFHAAGARRALDVLDRGLVILIAIAYIAVLVWLATAGDARFWKALLVPAVTFALVTAIRTALDRPRPYALYDIDPILVKERQGKSFPSRHVSSAVIIACALLWINAAWGAPALVACGVVATTRIIGGVHFPRDVIAAIAIAAACALVGFLVIP